MPEEVKKTVERVAKTLSSFPADTRELAARLAETYATGLSVGMELVQSEKQEVS